MHPQIARRAREHAWPTIARRVDFLQKMAADPDLEPRFQRRVGLVKWGMLLSLAAVLAALGPDKLWEVLGKLGN